MKVSKTPHSILVNQNNVIRLSLEIKRQHKSSYGIGFIPTIIRKGVNL